jgi:hypothetical protein
MPGKLIPCFSPGNEIVTMSRRGWLGKKNGELLRLSQRDFDALVAMARSIPRQQNLSGIDLAVIVLEAPSNRPADLIPLVGDIEAALIEARPGEVIRVVAWGVSVAGGGTRIPGRLLKYEP